MIKVGGATEIEVKEKKDRVDDALNATRAAVEEGIVPGGGVALLRAKKAVDALKSDNPDIQMGLNIVSKALGVPIRQIAENSGVEGSIVVGKVLEKSGNYGFDAQTRSMVTWSRRHRRSDQGRSHCLAGRGVGRLTADHHRGDDRRKAKEKARRQCRAAAEWVAWAEWITEAI